MDKETIVILIMDYYSTLRGKRSSNIQQHR